MNMTTEKIIEIKGQKIIEVRKMTQKEMDVEGWDDELSRNLAVVLVLKNGVRIYASQDDEGNGLGTLFGTDKDGESFYLRGE